MSSSRSLQRQAVGWDNPALLEAFTLTHDGQTWQLTCRCGWQETIGLRVVLTALLTRARTHWIKAH